MRDKDESRICTQGVESLTKDVLETKLSQTDNANKIRVVFSEPFGG